MGDKPDRFYSPPAILIEIAIPKSQEKEALREMRVMCHNMKLMYEIKEKRPDINFPKSTFYAIMVKYAKKIKSGEDLVRATNAVQEFQGLFQVAITLQNNDLKKLERNSIKR